MIKKNQKKNSTEFKKPLYLVFISSFLIKYLHQAIVSSLCIKFLRQVIVSSLRNKSLYQVFMSSFCYQFFISSNCIKSSYPVVVSRLKDWLNKRCRKTVLKSSRCFVIMQPYFSFKAKKYLF